MVDFIVDVSCRFFNKYFKRCMIEKFVINFFNFKRCNFLKIVYRDK